MDEVEEAMRRVPYLEGYMAGLEQRVSALEAKFTLLTEINALYHGLPESDEEIRGLAREWSKRLIHIIHRVNEGWTLDEEA